VLWLPLLPSADEIMQPGCLSFCRQVAGFDNWPAKGLIKPPYKPAAERLVEGKAAYRAWLQSAEGAGCTYVLPDTDDEEDDDDEDTKGGKGKKKKVAAKKQQAKPKKQKTDPKPEKKETKKKQQKKTTATTRKDNVKVEVVPVETAGEVVGMDGAGGAGGDDDDDESESESGEDADEFEVSEILAERVGKRGKLEYRYVQYSTVHACCDRDRRRCCCGCCGCCGCFYRRAATCAIEYLEWLLSLTHHATCAMSALPVLGTTACGGRVTVRLTTLGNLRRIFSVHQRACLLHFGRPSR
jgi:hypothetical protein